MKPQFGKSRGTGGPRHANVIVAGIVRPARKRLSEIVAQGKATESRIVQLSSMVVRHA